MRILVSSGPELSLRIPASDDVTAHSIIALAGGSFAVAWTETRFGNPNVTLFVERFDSTGTPEAPVFSATSTPQTVTGRILNPDIVPLSQVGGYGVAWEYEQTVDPSSTDILFRRFSAGNATIGSQSALTTDQTSSERDVKLASLAGGRFAAAWEQDGDIFVRTHAADGRSTSAQVRANVFTSNAQDSPDIAALEGGGFVVVWSSFNQIGLGREVLARRFDATGVALGTEIFINSNIRYDQDAPAVAALEGGGFAVAWVSRTSTGQTLLQGANFNASGQRVGFELQLNDPADTVTIGKPQVIGLPGGGYAVAYEHGADISVRMVDQDGRLDGAIVNIDGSGFLRQPHLALLSDERLVLSFQDDGDLSARIFDISEPGQSRTGGPIGDNFIGGRGNDTLAGRGGNDTLDGVAGNDILLGENGNDTLYGGGGADTLNGGSGDDFIFGGPATADLRDVIYGGDGNDSVQAGAGNDEASGGNGNDALFGDQGSDTLIGNDGNDLIAGGAGSDLMFGNAGADTLNGGFGFDRMNGGTGADTFFHTGDAGHASDWIQDYNAIEGDRLSVGLAGAVRSDFQVNFAVTPGAGAAGVAEAFVIYRPTGQILFALVDGAAQTVINLQIGTQVHDLLA